jgi:hypothetical protein
MSTNINIALGDEALFNRAKQQQNASRQAQLEKEAAQRLETQATSERTKALTAQGKDAAGNAINGSLTKTPQLERRPAANRISGDGFVLVPSADYTSFGFEAKTIGIKNTKFTNVTAGATGDYTEFFRPEYVATGGPANASYLRAQLTIPGSTYIDSLTYLACDTPGVQGIRFSDPIRVLTTGGEVIPQQIKKPLHKLTSYTVECYLQAAANGPVSGFNSVQSETQFDVIVYSEPASTRLVRGFLIFNANGVNANTFRLELRGADQALNANVYFGYDSPDKPEGTYIWPTRLEFGGWYHVAYVRNNNVESFYFEGTLIKTQTSDLSFVSNIPKEALTQVFLDFTYGEAFPSGNPILQPGLHGFRFTDKALYNTDFVPPPQITTLG